MKCDDPNKTKFYPYCKVHHFNYNIILLTHPAVLIVLKKNQAKPNKIIIK